VDWLRIAPFVALHVGCLAVFWVGASPTALGVALGSYLLRTFAISGFFHRGFAHRAFRCGRVAQFAFALLGTTATQRGPLWWVAHHRRHHAHADTAHDPHEAGRGFWWSHMGWFLCKAGFDTRLDRVGDLARFPELRWLNRFDWLPPTLFAVGLFALGEALPVIGKLLGHSKLETTARYAHLARDSAQEAAGRVAESIAEDML
jgi:stearoyl-CoA desaturase (delta-9 desaturase)